MRGLLTSQLWRRDCGLTRDEIESPARFISLKA
jgi:hypothetical protein